MFDVVPESRPASPAASRPTTREEARVVLGRLAERTRPVTASRTRLLPLAPPLVDLFPEPGLRRGSTVVVTGLGGGGTAGVAGGGLALALAVVSAASGRGSWGAVVGVDDLGGLAAHELGLRLDRLVVVPGPGPAWAEVVATVLDGVDLVLLRPPVPPRPAMVRRLVARARERGAVLVVVPGRGGWPEAPDVHLRVDSARWEGVGRGEGHLRRRELTVVATGRRAAARPRQRRLWLPTAAGGVAGSGD